MGVNARLDVKITGADQLLSLQQLCDPVLVNKVTAAGVKYAAGAAKTAVGKEVGARYNLTAARIKRDVAGPRFSQGGKLATLYLSTKPPSALSYGGRDKGKGLTMRIFKGGKVEPVTFGFIGKAGKLQGKPFRRVGPGRDAALEFVSGPSIGRIFAGDSRYGPELRAAVSARINDQFIKGMQRALDSAARGFGGRK